MIRPIEDKVYLTPLRPPDYIGNIYIPDQSLPRVTQGIVKYLGPKCHNVKEGDHCLFSGYSGATIFVEGEGELIIMREKYVLAVLEDEPLEVSGLFFRAKTGDIFPATYEEAIGLCVKALRTRYNDLKITNDIETRPTLDDLKDDEGI